MLPGCPLLNLFPPDRPDSQKLRVKRDEKGKYVTGRHI
jgi:hypothetical protein